MVVTYVVSEVLTFLVYSLVAAAFATYLRHRHVRVLSRIFVMLSLVFSLCGATHLVGLLMFAWPAYWFDAILRLISAGVGVAALILIVRNLPRIMKMPRAGKESELYEEIYLLRQRVSTTTKPSEILQAVIDDIKKHGAG